MIEILIFSSALFGECRIKDGAFMFYVFHFYSMRWQDFACIGINIFHSSSVSFCDNVFLKSVIIWSNEIFRRSFDDVRLRGFCCLHMFFFRSLVNRILIGKK